MHDTPSCRYTALTLADFRHSIVQEALAKPPGSKMYAFGTVALRQFVGIVYLWPQFCSRILQVRTRLS